MLRYQAAQKRFHKSCVASMSKHVCRSIVVRGCSDFFVLTHISCKRGVSVCFVTSQLAIHCIRDMECEGPPNVDFV